MSQQRVIVVIPKIGKVLFADDVRVYGPLGMNEAAELYQKLREEYGRDAEIKNRILEQPEVSP